MFSEKQIKRTTEYNFEVEQKFGEWKSILDFKIVTEYDQNGDVIKIFSYFQDGVNDEFRFTLGILIMNLRFGKGIKMEKL